MLMPFSADGAGKGKGWGPIDVDAGRGIVRVWALSRRYRGTANYGAGTLGSAACAAELLQSTPIRAGLHQSMTKQGETLRSR